MNHTCISAIVKRVSDQFQSNTAEDPDCRTLQGKKSQAGVTLSTAIRCGGELPRNVNPAPNYPVRPIN